MYYISSINKFLLNKLSGAAVLVFAAFVAGVAPARSQEAPENFVSLTAGTPPPLTNLNVGLTNAGPGANALGQPPGIAGFNAQANMGDLSRVTSNSPAQAIVGLRVGGDQSYVLMVSQLSFVVNNLQYRGVDLQGTQDRGSFIRMAASRPIAVGPRSNAGASNVSGAFAAEGIVLSQLANGAVTTASTPLMSGASPVITDDTNTMPVPAMPVVPDMPVVPGSPGPPIPSGSNDVGGQSMIDAAAQVAAGAPPFTGRQQRAREILQSGVEVAVYLTVPTGLALGPVSASSPGTFATNLQFGVFPLP